ncbi:MAG: hypothetical protein CME43_01760 [Haliea sp.]|uniref:DUF4376 domain-containing protein n=1 Tax=Haliea sp. TaxID=1932666 RepID=UPI000C5A0DAE|nr:DUF4376 domain-containing protein [Haliea sp.]MBM68188.1 hypothetical protein [Haliea sp.]|tara:strand:- start:31263 stop:31913 length:651 start_codon:yes stop_codon:yes gene_type:complete
MLTFIDENDFLKVDTFKENEDGAVSWVWDEGEGLPTHSGVIREDFKRYTQEQQGTEEVVVGQDEEGNDITEEQPKMVDVEINVWEKLWELHDDSNSDVSVSPIGIDLLRNNAKSSINSLRDGYIHGGVEFNNHTYQTDQQSISDLMGAVLSGVDTTWLTVDNIEVELTSSELQQLGQTVAAHKKHYVYKARQHKDYINALETQQEIDNYMANLDWS